MLITGKPSHVIPGRSGSEANGLPVLRFLKLTMPVTVGTWKGFRAWAHSDDFPEKGRICYLHKRIHVDMSPEEIETHTKVKEAIHRGIGTLNEEIDLGEFFADGVLVSNEAADLSTVPDGSFVKWETSAAGLVRFVARRERLGQYIELQGTPDWMLEVVSQSSVEKDTVDLPILYHRAGIGEFWLVDARGPEVDFQILVKRRGKYVAVKPENGWHRSPLFGRSFRLLRRRNRAGRWTYKLENQ